MTRFVVTFRPAPGNDGIRGVRAILKIARRRFGLVAIDAREVVDTVEASDAKHPNVHEQFLELVRSITAAR